MNILSIVSSIIDILVYPSEITQCSWDKSSDTNSVVYFYPSDSIHVKHTKNVVSWMVDEKNFLIFLNILSI